MSTPANSLGDQLRNATGKTSTSQQLSVAKAQVKQTQAKIDLLKAQKSKLKKPNPKDKSAVAKYNLQVKHFNDQISTYTSTLTATNKRVGTLQNKYYSETGQYDKLLTGSNRDAYLALKSVFDSYGLGSLADKIYNYVKNGESADTISIQLQDTPEYKKRFAGNELRKKAGLPVLNPADYLATEASYRQIMQQAGMPSGFYDKPDDFDDWIGKNVSPSEIQSRVDLATQATILSDPN